MVRSDRTKFTAYITKYALTSGIEAIEVEDCFDISQDMVAATKNKYRACYHGKDWHRTKEEASARAEEMRIAKIASHRKSIAKLEKLRFSGPTP